MKKRQHALIDEPREPLRASFRGGSGKPREVSVASLYRPADGAGGEGERVPCLHISGRGLVELGFVKGRRVVVASEEERLMLTVPKRQSLVIRRYEAGPDASHCGAMPRQLRVSSR